MARPGFSCTLTSVQFNFHHRALQGYVYAMYTSIENEDLIFFESILVLALEAVSLPLQDHHQGRSTGLWTHNSSVESRTSHERWDHSSSLHRCRLLRPFEHG
jgi:hypothetical protein